MISNEYRHSLTTASFALKDSLLSAALYLQRGEKHGSNYTTQILKWSNSTTLNWRQDFQRFEDNKNASVRGKAADASLASLRIFLLCIITVCFRTIPINVNSVAAHCQLSTRGMNQHDP